MYKITQDKVKHDLLNVQSSCSLVGWGSVLQLSLCERKEYFSQPLFGCSCTVSDIKTVQLPPHTHTQKQTHTHALSVVSVSGEICFNLFQQNFSTKWPNYQLTSIKAGDNNTVEGHYVLPVNYSMRCLKNISRRTFSSVTE